MSFQRDAALSSLYFISLQDFSTCFGCSLRPSSGVFKIVCATTGTSHTVKYKGLQYDLYRQQHTLNHAGSNLAKGTSKVAAYYVYFVTKSAVSLL
jgi:hypothetical protein